MSDVEAVIEAMGFVLMVLVAQSLGGVELPLRTARATLLAPHRRLRHAYLVRVEVVIEAMEFALMVLVAQSLGGVELPLRTARAILLDLALLALLAQLHQMVALTHVTS